MAGAKSAANRAKMGRMLTAVGRGLTGDSEMAKTGMAIGKGLRQRADRKAQRDPMGGRRKAERER